MKGTLNVGHIDYELSTSWVKIGPIAGFLGIAAYFAAATNLLPSRVTLILAFAMGPLLSAAFIGGREGVAAGLKLRLSGTHARDQLGYTQAKSRFVRRLTETARRHYAKQSSG